MVSASPLPVSRAVPGCKKPIADLISDTDTLSRLADFKKAREDVDEDEEDA